ncbi:hypothetical protein DID88_005103 [Monilinia fructigena]|uniref:G-patch domain-containing protein n=1 Tax=Monilinia fructigena TaxID=38457 RepID=A0A395ISF4_9HELO|nr:hypothetical protein DID88_005103 [Monilinia fructigena]
MGLSAPKNKIKLSHDPNNTRWSGNTDSFGHRMMKSQGWTPGEYLGAKDAAHAEFPPQLMRRIFVWWLRIK